MSFACSRSIVWLARLFVCVPMALQAQSRSTPPVRGAVTLDSLAARYVAALRARDTATENALTHSASLRCPSAHDTLFQNPTRRFQDSVRAGKIDGPFRLIVHDMSDSLPRVGSQIYLPVAAPKQIQIDFIGPSGSSFGLAHRVALDKGRWFLVNVCFTADGVRTFMPVRKPR